MSEETIDDDALRFSQNELDEAFALVLAGEYVRPIVLRAALKAMAQRIVKLEGATGKT